jgi:branched-chain amino acid transport system permease protein
MGLAIASGLTLGAIYALIASSFTLAQVPTGIFNFAQGALVVAGAFLTYYFFTSLHLPWPVTLVLNLCAGLVLGTVCEVATVRSLRWTRTAKSGPAELVTTVGMATLLVGAMGLIWGYNPLSVPFRGPANVVTILGTRVEPLQIIIFAVSIVVAVALHFWFKLTRYGQSCLAVAEDRDTAMLRGINVNLVSTGAFAAAGALAAVSGMLIGPITYALPTLANPFALAGFVALALGGQSSFLGGLFGGMLVGLVSTLAAVYIGPSYQDISVLALLLVVLTVRPHGISGARLGRRV